jgi:hypothetical protein
VRRIDLGREIELRERFGTLPRGQRNARQSPMHDRAILRPARAVAADLLPEVCRGVRVPPGEPQGIGQGESEQGIVRIDLDGLFEESHCAPRIAPLMEMQISGFTKQAEPRFHIRGASGFCRQKLRQRLPLLSFPVELRQPAAHGACVDCRGSRLLEAGARADAIAARQIGVREPQRALRERVSRRLPAEPLEHFRRAVVLPPGLVNPDQRF